MAELFSKTTVKRMELCRSKREFELEWILLPFFFFSLRLSKWAELSVSLREVNCDGIARELFRFRDALITSATNCLTSFLAGFVVFSVLGYMAQEQRRDIADVARQGQGHTMYPSQAVCSAVLLSFVFC